MQKQNFENYFYPFMIGNLLDVIDRSALGSQPDAVPQAEGGIGQVHFGRK